MRVFDKARFQFDDFWSSVLSIYPSMRAGRHYGRALRLEAAGRHAEAFELTTRALAALPEPPRGLGGAVLGARLGLAVLHAQLATSLGRPELAQPEIRKTLQVCGTTSTDHPAVRERLNWLRGQLDEDGSQS